MKVYFVGAGPGDPDLLTLKATRIIKEADVIIYAGSLVSRKVLQFASPGAEVYDSSSMNFDEITGLYFRERKSQKTFARVHTGDPSLYGAIQEQIDWCTDHGIDCEVIPGVSSFTAGAAVLRQELTLPGVSQSVIITRLSGKTPVPEKEDLEKLARSKATMVIFLSVRAVEKVVAKLMQHYRAETPAAVLYRISWPDEKVLTGTLSNIADKVQKAGIGRQAIILVGEVLRRNYARSNLYDPGCSHTFRRAKKKLESDPSRGGGTL